MAAWTEINGTNSRSDNAMFAPGHRNGMNAMEEAIVRPRFWPVEVVKKACSGLISLTRPVASLWKTGTFFSKRYHIVDYIINGLYDFSI